jgi:hypothetical protein
MVATIYNCTQTELYKACRFAWLLCQEYIAEFADYKSIYNAAFIAQNLALINAVEGMDNHEARTAPVKDLRKDLVAERSDASDFFKLLKGYCATAFKDDTVTRNAMYDEAGQTYFNKISNGSWTDVAGLLTAMIPFVQNKKDILIEKGYMPEAFLTRLQDKQTSFKAARLKWETESAATPTSTDSKIVANNDLKIRVMEMLGDGQLVFIKDKDKAQKFVWTTIVSQMRAPRPTGLGGRVTIGDTKKGIANATATIASLNITVTCDADGRYEFMDIEAGKYTLEFKAEGYEPVVVEDRQVTEGVKGRLNVSMAAAVVAAAA